MKKILISCFLCIAFVSAAQIKNGSIVYGSTTMFDTSSNSDLVIEELETNKKDENRITFTLNFNLEEAYFFVNPILGSTAESVQDYCSLASIKTQTYLKPSTNEFRKIGYYRGAAYIRDQEQKAEWELSTETKTINGYLCYKATSIYNNGKWDDNPKFTVTAWYAPKIPVSFGPNGYHGLPGLILELQTYTTTLFVTKIDLNLNKKLEIDPLKKGVFMTEDQIRVEILNASAPPIRKFMEAEFKKEDERDKAVELRILEKKSQVSK